MIIYCRTFIFMRPTTSQIHSRTHVHPYMTSQDRGSHTHCHTYYIIIVVQNNNNVCALCRLRLCTHIFHVNVFFFLLSTHSFFYSFAKDQSTKRKKSKKVDLVFGVCVCVVACCLALSTFYIKRAPLNRKKEGKKKKTRSLLHHLSFRNEFHAFSRLNSFHHFPLHERGKRKNFISHLCLREI